MAGHSPKKNGNGLFIPGSGKEIASQEWLPLERPQRERGPTSMRSWMEKRPPTEAASNHQDQPDD